MKRNEFIGLFYIGDGIKTNLYCFVNKLVKLVLFLTQQY